MTMTTKDKQAVRDAVSADHKMFKKDGTAVFKRSYFYHHGQTADGVAERITKQVEAAGFKASDVEATDQFARWPKTSYFVVSMKVTKA